MILICLELRGALETLALSHQKKNLKNNIFILGLSILVHPSENAVKEQNEDLHHKPRNNPGDHCAASGVLSAGRSFLQTDVGIERLTD